MNAHMNHPGGTSSSPLLQAVDLVAGYGEMPVIRDINLEVGPGEVVALLGRNGAGKSTTLLTLAGHLQPMGGQVVRRGTTPPGSLPARAKDGMAFIPEERAIFRELSVAENLRLGRGTTPDALALFPELREHLQRPAGLLSGGQQQMLTLARAVAGKPDVLLADELSLGLAPVMVQRVLSKLREQADAGLGVLLVEQHVRQALSVADRGYLMDRGRIVMSGTASELRSHLGEIERAYLDGIAEQSA